jgi:hypothetical protein
VLATLVARAGLGFVVEYVAWFNNDHLRESLGDVSSRK